MRGLLGDSGAQCCEMAKLGLPISPGFCAIAPKSGDGWEATKAALAEVEEVTGARYGDVDRPLLLSVRMAGSCALPVLSNIGLNDAIAETWASRESPNFIWDSYRRLIQEYARIKGLDLVPFEQEIDDAKRRLDVKCGLGRRHDESLIPTRDLRDIVLKFQDIYLEQAGEQFPQDPHTQLMGAMASVAPTGLAGSVVAIVQAMVFGNFDFRSAAGLAFQESFDGFADVSGEWLMKAQIDDVIRGARTRRHLTTEASMDWAESSGVEESERQEQFLSLEEDMPSAFAQLVHCQNVLGGHLPEFQGVEFVIQQGRLWLMGSTRDADVSFSAVLGSESHSGETVWENEGGGEPASDDLTDLDDVFNCVGGVSEDAVADQENVEQQCFQTSTEECQDTEAQVLGDPAVHEGSPVGEATHKSSWPVRKVHHRFRGPRAHLGDRRRHPSRTSTAQRKEIAQGCDITRILSPRPIEVWQTMLAGASAGIACKTLGTVLQNLAVGSGVRALLEKEGFAALFAGNAAACAKMLPTGAICCTCYVNLLRVTATDEQGNSAPLFRLGCATVAAGCGHTVAYPVGVFQTQMANTTPATGRDFGRLMTGVRGLPPALGAAVPTMALELCAIDFVRQAALQQGYEATPGMLLGCGAVAGVLVHGVVNPMQKICQGVCVGRPRGDRVRGVASAMAGVGTVCLRSAPVVALNSLVRVGLVTYFSG